MKEREGYIGIPSTSHILVDCVEWIWVVIESQNSEKEKEEGVDIPRIWFKVRT